MNSMLRSGADLAALGRVAKNIAPAFWRHYREERGTKLEAAPFRPTPALWPDRGLFAAWLGHSTVLLKIDGIVILTDPVLSTRVGLSFGPFTLGLKRLVAPALGLKEIPSPDVILLSHAHMDHFDLPTLRSLESRNAAVVTASRTSDLLRVKRYGAVHELAWGESVSAAGVNIQAVEVRHWGARMQTDQFRGYNGYLIETPRYRVLFGGDTAFTDAFRHIRSERRLDLAIMPIGAYDPWIAAHCNPEQALRMANDAGAEMILPVHHQTFRLSREPRMEPIERLLHAAKEQRVAWQKIGQEFHIA